MYLIQTEYSKNNLYTTNVRNIVKWDYISLLTYRLKIKYYLFLMSYKYIGKANNAEIINIVINRVYIKWKTTQKINLVGIK